MINFWINISDTNRWKKILQKWYLLLIVLFIYVPLFVFVSFSFNQPSAKGNVVAGFNSFSFKDNYWKFFTDSSFHENMPESLLNSFLIAALSVPVSLFVGLMTAVCVWKNFGKGKKPVFLFCNITISSPDIFQAVAFSIMFANLFVPLGINLGFFSIILSHIALQIPYVIVFLYPKLMKLNKNLLFASYDLNFNFFEAVMNVIVPSLSFNLLGASILSFALSFDDYIITNFVRGGVPTISTELYNMKTGIKAWSAVFGSLIIMGVILITGCYSIFQFLKLNNFVFFTKKINIKKQK